MSSYWRKSRVFLNCFSMFNIKSSVIRWKGRSQNEFFKKTRHAKFSEKQKNCSFFRKFGMLYFLETPVLRFTLFPYYRQNVKLLKKATMYCNRRTYGIEKWIIDFNGSSFEKGLELGILWFNYLNISSCMLLLCVTSILFILLLWFYPVLNLKISNCFVFFSDEKLCFLDAIYFVIACYIF